MHTAITHLPESHQQKLQQLVRTILETVLPEKIILFGNYAQGMIVEHCYLGKDGIFNEYVLDYDVLLIVSNPKENARRVEEMFDKIKLSGRQGFNLLVHDRAFVNQSIADGWHFFSDIPKEGILLFDDGSLPLAQPNHLTDEEKRRINKQNFEAGMTTLSAYLQTALAAFENNEAGKCLGNLYKAAECLYKTMLILHISYPSDTNQLKKLRQQCKNFSEALWLLFNLKDSETDRRLFTLLHDANDNPDIKIDRQDILALQHKLNSMERIVKESCEELM